METLKKLESQVNQLWNQIQTAPDQTKARAAYAAAYRAYKLQLMIVGAS